MKKPKIELENGPPAKEVLWMATDPKGNQALVRAQTWYRARHIAAAELLVEPDHLEVQQASGK